MIIMFFFEGRSPFGKISLSFNETLANLDSIFSTCFHLHELW